MALSFSSVHAPGSTFPSIAMTHPLLLSLLFACVKIHAQVADSSAASSTLVSRSRIADVLG
jgi:hypothetical protein